MTDYGLVSIITPAYNAATYLPGMIDSILAQTYQHWELLITDDCSTDATCEVVSRYAAADSRIRLFRLPVNSGAGAARNKSIAEAQGRYIAFCDSDDQWRPEKLARQLAVMHDRGDVLSYTSYSVVDERGNVTARVKCKPRLSYRTMLRGNEIGCLTAIYDAKALGKQYMPQIRKRQDWCLWLSIIKKVGTARGVSEDLAIYCDRRHSISSNKWAMLGYNFKVYHEVEGFSRMISWILLYAYFLPYYFYKKSKLRFSV